jgi:8-oxo-dGTP pyrophosphatase MutT (NUDIX family)
MASPVFHWQPARQRLLQRLAGTRANHDPAQWRLGLAPLAAADARLQAMLPHALRPSAVLIPLLDRPDGPGVLLTVRASGLRHHAGQVAFPGGHIETDDADPTATALREAREEVGLNPDQVQVVGFLPDHVILSGFRVTPVVALVQPQAVLRWDPAEVAGAFELPLAVLLDASQHSVGSRLINDVPVVTRDILYGPHRIWGATAAMLFCLRAWAIGEDLS